MNRLNTNDDGSLISRFKNGDRKAFDIIVLKYQKKIYGHVYRMVLNHDEADDITQEVFIKIYRSISGFRGDSSLYTWIYKIAVNYTLNYLKKRKSDKTVSMELLPNDIYANTDKLGDEIDQENRLRLIENAIASLPDQQRTVFSLRYYDKMSYDEISTVMNRSVGAVKANYFHAFKKISDYLKEKLKENV
ncbi:MAG: sigma-70 family RNA polymerase sigma factor [Ignavibacteria bacterium]|nr:sigma-70 family RNA polymerase sigma factor [Ignavibacteria bacterium]